MATIKDIAEKAGISPAAVSRILNNDTSLSVSPSTRERVIHIAKEMNYKKSKPVKHNDFKLGIVQWFSAEEEAKDSYYLLVRNGIEDFCKKNHIKIERAFKSDKDYTESIKNVNGLICIGKFSSEEIDDFYRICPNVVFLDMEIKDYNISTLTMDFKNAVYDALQYLYDLGHREIAFLGGAEYVGEYKKEKVIDERNLAYVSFMKKKHLNYKEYMWEGTFDVASGYEMMTRLLSTGKHPTAVFASSDSIAFGAMKAIKDHGLSIPDDISIIGFNDIEMSAFTSPALTTIHAPAYDMGQHGANLIYVASNLSISTPIKVKIPCTLIKRDSCAAPHSLSNQK